jgi:hypothetical protein
MLLHLKDKLNAFRQEWSKARRHMLTEKQRNMANWRERKGSASR